MSKFEFRVGVDDGLIVVTEPTSHFYAVYGQGQGQRRLILARRRPTKDNKLVAEARKAANAKARELGWILGLARAQSEFFTGVPQCVHVQEMTGSSIFF